MEKSLLDSKYAGIAAWAAIKYDDINDAWELYEESKSKESLLNVISETSEIVAISIISLLATNAIDKTGLDKVFDSMMRESLPNEVLDKYTTGEYNQRIKNKKAFTSLVIAFGAEALLEYINKVIAETGALDPLFDFIGQLNVFGSFLGTELYNINQATHTSLQSALDFVFRRDPLVLDLDSDGIETTPADGSVLFDHNADNQKTATGWIAPDDGLLVLDRNGNGTIDNGRELFGDNTLKNNGELATNGFDALADLDANQDGLVDINDTEFANLRVWQDLNQDGISQNNELFTLDQLNIQSITTANDNVLQGNPPIINGDQK